MRFEQVISKISSSNWCEAIFGLFSSLWASKQLSWSSMQPLLKLGLLDLAQEAVHGHHFDSGWCYFYLFCSKETSLVRELSGIYSLYKIRPRIRGLFLFQAWIIRIGANALRTMVRLGGSLTVDDLQEWDADGVPLTHLLFYCLGDKVRLENFASEEMTAWDSLIKELVAAGADLHARRYLFGCKAPTPFLYAVQGMLKWTVALEEPRPYHLSRHFRLGLKRIVETLRGCGLDLYAFGSMEDLGVRGNYGICILFKKSRQAVQLEKVCYGPSVADWRLEWGFVLSNEDLVGEFWQMVETPSQSMPGTWPDSDSDTHSYTDGHVIEFA